MMLYRGVYALFLYSLAGTALLTLFAPSGGFSQLVRVTTFGAACLGILIVWSGRRTFQADGLGAVGLHARNLRIAANVLIVSTVTSAMQWAMLFDRINNPSLLNTAFNLLHLALFAFLAALCAGGLALTFTRRE